MGSDGRAVSKDAFMLTQKGGEVSVIVSEDRDYVTLYCRRLGGNYQAWIDMTPEQAEELGRALIDQ